MNIEKLRQELEADMLAAPVLDIIKDNTGVDVYNFPQDEVPQTPEELSIYMQLSYKQGVEVAQETAIETLLELNNYDEVKRRIDEDNVVLGISAVKHSFNSNEGVKVEYVAPVNLVYSQTEDPSFRDCYYFGEVKSVHIGEIKKINPKRLKYPSGSIVPSLLAFNSILCNSLRSPKVIERTSNVPCFVFTM